MLARLLIVTFISLLALFTEPAAAERRVALVLGNGAYKHAVKLPNPARDAEAMADLLRSLGFDIVFGNDLGRDAIRAVSAYQ